MTFILLFLILGFPQHSLQQNCLRWEMDEELNVNTPIKSLQSDGPRNADSTSYHMITASEHGVYFHVDSNTGMVSIAQRVDREELCGEQAECVLRFQVTMLNKVGVDTVSVCVHVRDIDDNGCVFWPNAMQTVKLPENTRPGENPIILNTPKDMDVSHTVVADRVSFTSRDPAAAASVQKLFELQVNQVRSTPTTPLQLRLKLIAPLDYEKVRSYALRFHASDASANVSHGCTLDVNVEVTDVNDNAPKFSQHFYVVEVPEGQKPASTPFITVTATDNDSGPFGEIEYSIAPTVDSQTWETFRINPRTGELFLNKQLDYIRRKQYKITVLAKNPGESSLSLVGTAEVQVNVQDVNNHAPNIVITSVTGVDKLSIPENNLEKEFVVSLLLVNDKDAGQNGKVSCRMDWCQVPNALQLETYPGKDGETKYKVVATRPFDRETNSHITFRVTCSDHGNPSLNASREASLQVLDVNDNSPSFVRLTNSSGYFASVFEDSDPDRGKSQYLITQVEAMDPDLGENATVTYSLIQVPPKLQGFVNISPTDGKLYSNGSLDRENDAFATPFTVTVEARDQGRGFQMSSTAQVTVTLKDWNDNAPDCAHHRNHFNVDENTPIPHLVGRITMWDDDIGENGALTVSLKKSITPRFGIDGERVLRYFNITYLSTEREEEIRVHTVRRSLQHFGLFLIKPIDRESFLQPSNSTSTVELSMMLVLKDRGHISLSYSCMVEVEIRDINDNSPSFTRTHYGGYLGENSTVEVSFLESVAYEIGKVKAVDPDAGVNGSVTYRIIEGNPQQYFFLDTRGGVGILSVAKILGRDALREHVLVVEAADGGHPESLKNRTIVRVNVTNSPAKGVPAYGHPHGRGESRELDSAINMYIIVAIVVSSLLISVILLTAICVVLRRSRRSPRGAYSSDGGDGYSKDDHGVSPYLLGDGSYLMSQSPPSQTLFPPYTLEDHELAQTLNHYSKTLSGTMKIPAQISATTGTPLLEMYHTHSPLSPAYADYCPEALQQRSRNLTPDNQYHPVLITTPPGYTFATLAHQAAEVGRYFTPPPGANMSNNHAGGAQAGVMNLATFKETGDQDSGKGDSLDAGSRPGGVHMMSMQIQLPTTSGDGTLHRPHLTGPYHPPISIGSPLKLRQQQEPSPITVRRDASPWIPSTENVGESSFPRTSPSSVAVLHRIPAMPSTTSNSQRMVPLLLQKDGDAVRTVPMMSTTHTTTTTSNNAIPVQHCIPAPSNKGEGSFV